MKVVIHSPILPDNIKISLLNEGFTLIEGSFSTVIDNETRYHPDMLYFKLPSGKLLVSDKINNVHNLDTFAAVEKTRTLQGAVYPKDCVLNDGSSILFLPVLIRKKACRPLSKNARPNLPINKTQTGK